MNILRNVLQVVLPVAATLGIMAVLASAVYSLLKCDKVKPLNSKRRITLSHATCILGIFLVSRVFILGVAALSTGEGFVNIFQNGVRWDASHYVDLIKDWYVNYGDAANFIVFFPLYPFLGRVLYTVFGIEPVLAAYIVSNLAMLGACYTLYAYMRFEFTEKESIFGVILLCCNPACFFYMLPFTESLFVLCCLLACLEVRKRRWFYAGIFGIFAALCRNVGIFICAYMFVEALLCFNAERKANDKSHCGRRFVLRVCASALPVLGTVLYLVLNYKVTGNAFTFMTVQREHWNNTVIIFVRQIANVTNYLWDYSSLTLWIWVPHLVGLFTVLGLLIAGRRRLRASENIFAIMMLIMDLSGGWPLSGLRYYTAIFPVTLAATAVCDKLWKKIVLLVLSLALLVFYTYGYYSGKSVM